MNPFLKDYNTPFNTTPFDKIKNEHFMQALDAAILEGKKNIKAIIENTQAPSFSNVLANLDHAFINYSLVENVFYNLLSANTNDELQKIAMEFSPLSTEFMDSILFNKDLFDKVKAVYDQKDDLILSVEEQMVLEKSYKSFTRNGALLNDNDKKSLGEMNKELSLLTIKFSENILNESKSYLMLLENKEDLVGLPDSVINAATILASDKGHAGKWAFNFDYPSSIPFMKYSAKRDLRYNFYKDMVSRAHCNENFDNKEVLLSITNLKNGKAKLLGYKNHADYILEERMAGDIDTVNSFLNNLLEKTMPFAKKDLRELIDFAKDTDQLQDFNNWDYAYYAEKLKNKRFNLDDEKLRPYFKLENVVNGIFKVAQKLYGIEFKKNDSISVYHKDVDAYELLNEKGEHFGVFYTDFFPRPEKKSGAWATEFQSQYVKDKVDHRPHSCIVCNFTPPTKETPSLLSFDELITLYHEFGHALHCLLSECHYSSVSTFDVYWDFVELPSQIMENWAYEKECLDLFAFHYKTGEKIPEEYISKIQESLNFQEGWSTLRQISFSMLDLSWYAQDVSEVTDVVAYEKDEMQKLELLPRLDEDFKSATFSHIFSQEYSAGYYSYKWAEVLDADAFAYFKENGIFNQKIAASFRGNILKKGASEHPMTLYKRFRGRAPEIDALLERAGIDGGE